jgi:serine/threonine protein kinase
MAQSQDCGLAALQLKPSTSAAYSGHTLVEGEHEDLKRGSTLPFRYIGKLGVGASAVVDVVEDLTNGQTFAHKVFRPYSGHSKFFKKIFKNEVDIIKRLHSHPHIVQIYWSYTCGRELGMLLTPVASDKDLGSYLLDIQDTGEGPTQKQRDILLRAFGCLAGGLAYIHSHTIRHKDIKPQNILVHNGQMIYTDFGIALDANGQDTTTTGLSESCTKRYCAPEVANNQPRNRKSDVFSLGCVFIEMLSLLVPESRSNSLDPVPYWKRLNKLYFYSTYFSPYFPNLPAPFMELFKTCRSMMCPDIAGRIDASKLESRLWAMRHQQKNSVALFCDMCMKPARVAPLYDLDTCFPIASSGRPKKSSFWDN